MPTLPLPSSNSLSHEPSYHSTHDSTHLIPKKQPSSSAYCSLTWPPLPLSRTKMNVVSLLFQILIVLFAIWFSSLTGCQCITWGILGHFLRPFSELRIWLRHLLPPSPTLHHFHNIVGLESVSLFSRQATPDETNSGPVRLPSSAQQWRYLQWPAPRKIWIIRQPLNTRIDHMQML